jgi:hypothetical protein
MTNTELKIGGIYKTQFDSRPYRIIGLDDYEVFYDCLWSDNKWTFSDNFKVKTIFYRMFVDHFALKSELIEFRKLTDIEMKYFRPDLPMRFGRIKNVSWNSIDSSGFRYLNSHFQETKITTNKIVLVPYGPKGALQKGIVIESNNELNIIEIIKQAMIIQSEVNQQKSNGIGFYRLGYEKGLPRYSIGEFFDKAGIMKE